jgi:glycerol-3-phosphate acyltransferase PlsY
MPWFEQFQAAQWTQACWAALAAYCLGCFTTGYYLVKFRIGRDLRELGSGTVGARNAGRVLGGSAFALTLLGDFLKGAFAVWVAAQFPQNSLFAPAALLGVVAGHIWPAQLWFHGGKGVATTLGGLIVLDPRLSAIFIVLFGAGSLLFRKTVLPGLFAFACLPFVSVFLDRNPLTVTAISMLSGMVLFAHQKNLREELGHLRERRHAHSKAHSTDL